jgi:hypothetical protein
MPPTIRNQAKLVGIALAAGLAVTAFGTGAALAVSPSQEQCEASGGTFTKVNGVDSCITSEQVASPNASDSNNSQTTTTNTSGQGNITPKEGTLTCSGPPGQQDPACP